MITFITGATREAEEFVKDNIDKIGNIIFIHHKRDRDQVSYVTTFKGENNTMEISGGITSGYDGAGPNGLIRVLVSLGIDKKLASDYVYGNSDKELHEFTIEF